MLFLTFFLCQLKKEEEIFVGYYFDLASVLLLVSLPMSLLGFATVEHQVRAQLAGVNDLGGNKLNFQLL